MSIRVDKRVPFGFKGVWGKVYKHNVYNETTDAITYQRSSYFDIGFDVQFKYLESGVDKQVFNTQSIANLIAEGSYRVVKSTDATLEGTRYSSVVQVGDIVLFEGRFWVVDKLDERSVYNPQKQTFYYIGMKDIFDEVIIGEN